MYYNMFFIIRIFHTSMSLYTYLPVKRLQNTKRWHNHYTFSIHSGLRQIKNKKNSVSFCEIFPQGYLFNDDEVEFTSIDACFHVHVLTSHLGGTVIGKINITSSYHFISVNFCGVEINYIMNPIVILFHSRNFPRQR